MGRVVHADTTAWVSTTAARNRTASAKQPAGSRPTACPWPNGVRFSITTACQPAPVGNSHVVLGQVRRELLLRLTALTRDEGFYSWAAVPAPAESNGATRTARWKINFHGVV